MALTAAQQSRLGKLYTVAVNGNWRFVTISQSDMQAALLANDAGDPVATVLNPSIAEIYPVAGIGNS